MPILKFKRLKGAALVQIADQHGKLGRVDISEFYPLEEHISGIDISAAHQMTNAPGATKLLIQATANNIRFTLDGTTPTVAIGFQLIAGDPAIIIPITEDTIVTIIEETATSVVQFQWGN